MRNQKLLAYIFSSSLLISTLPFNAVDAEVSEESPTQLKEKDIDDNKKQPSSDENNESTKDTNNTNKETTKNDDDEINQPSSSNKTRNKNALDKKENTYNKQDE
ncbi:N-acetylmuramoyl-L-alanine amidase, partial [Staphylococcus condimenti]